MGESEVVVDVDFSRKWIWHFGSFSRGILPSRGSPQSRRLGERESESECRGSRHEKYTRHLYKRPWSYVARPPAEPYLLSFIGYLIPSIATSSRSRTWWRCRVGSAIPIARHWPHAEDTATGDVLRNARRGAGLSRSEGCAQGRYPHPWHHHRQLAFTVPTSRPRCSRCRSSRLAITASGAEGSSRRQRRDRRVVLKSPDEWGKLLGETAAHRTARSFAASRPALKRGLRSWRTKLETDVRPTHGCGSTHGVMVGARRTESPSLSFGSGRGDCRRRQFRSDQFSALDARCTV
jgi:hypothetical protein